MSVFATWVFVALQGCAPPPEVPLGQGPADTDTAPEPPPEPAVRIVYPAVDEDSGLIMMAPPAEGDLVFQVVVDVDDFVIRPHTSVEEPANTDGVGHWHLIIGNGDIYFPTGSQTATATLTPDQLSGISPLQQMTAQLQYDTHEPITCDTCSHTVEICFADNADACEAR